MKGINRKNGKQLDDRRIMSFVSPLPPSTKSNLKSYSLKIMLHWARFSAVLQKTPGLNWSVLQYY